MKPKLLLLALALQVLYVQAQFEKGKWMIGGQTNANLYQFNGRNDLGATRTSRESDLDLNIWALNFLNKKKFIGLGIYNKARWNLRIPEIPDPIPPYYFLETYGLQFQYGKYCPLAKNIYLFTSAIVGVGIYNQSDNTNGFELRTSIRPFELSYVLKNRFVFQANLLQVNFEHWWIDLDRSATPTGARGESVFINTSFNPFSNQFSIFYLLKHKK